MNEHEGQGHGPCPRAYDFVAGLDNHHDAGPRDRSVGTCISAERLRVLDETLDALAARLSTIALLTAGHQQNLNDPRPEVSTDDGELLTQLRAASTEALQDLRAAVRAIPRRDGRLPPLPQRWEDVPALIERHQSTGVHVTMTGMPVSSVNLSLHAGTAAYMLLSTGMKIAETADYVHEIQIDLSQDYEKGMLTISVEVTGVDLHFPTADVVERIEAVGGRVTRLIASGDWRVVAELTMQP